MINVTRSSMPPYEEYIEAIRPLWDSRWLTNMGDYHKEFEASLKQYLKVPEISLTVNGHMGLEMTLQAFGFPSGGEVITTPFTFISTTHAILRNNLAPVFCDVLPGDGTIDPSKIEALITDKTVAILPVHVYGNICDVASIQEIAEKHNLKVIYDAAHAFGVEYNGIGIGNFGDASVFSFHATKVFHSIEGGAVAFKEQWLYEKLYNLKNFGIRGEEIVSDIGANAKMNEFSAIMGLCNLKHIDRAIASRKESYEAYEAGLAQIKGIQLIKNRRLPYKSNYAYLPILVTEDAGISRDRLAEAFRAGDIYVRKYFYPLTSNQECFKDQYKSVPLPNARRMSDRVLTLPIYEDLEGAVIERSLEIIKRNAK